MNRGIKFAKTIFPPESIERIERLNYFYQKRIKVIVFVTPDFADRITGAMAQAGAGKIGNYTECSYRANGTGTFRGGKKTNPYSGERGRFEKVNELRLEMICEHRDLNNVLDAMLRIHPYDEPAYEVYEVWVRLRTNSANTVKVTFKRPVELKKILSKINTDLITLNLPENLSGTKVHEAVINGSGKQRGTANVPDENRPVLYLTIHKNNSYNLTLK